MAEQKLWNGLRARSLCDAKFVRQESIGPFVADFVCRGKRLIIEVDGGQHAENAKDIRRDQWLRENGYRVLRFWNNDVMSNLEGVLQTIATALSAETPPHPDLLPARGEKEGEAELYVSPRARRGDPEASL